MDDILEFTATLKGWNNMQALYVEFPYDTVQLYGTRGQVKVKITFDDVPYRGSLAKMGMGFHWLLVRKDIQQQIGKKAGDLVQVTVQRDLEARIVEVPEDLAAAFIASPEAFARFEQLSYTNQKEYAVWIRDAKRPETRLRRIGDTIAKLLSGKKNPSDKN